MKIPIKFSIDFIKKPFHLIMSTCTFAPWAGQTFHGNGIKFQLK